MKKRKNKQTKDLLNQHEEIPQLNFQKIQPEEKTKKNNKVSNEFELIKEDIQMKKTEDKKSCIESFKQKTEYYWVKLINYLQFDRVLTQRDLEFLRNQSITFKTKYPENYNLTYQERQKTFGIAMQQIIRLKNQQQEIKSKNFWTQLKRFICCQGGNELEEADELLTAASDTDFFYVDRIKSSQEKNINFSEEPLNEEKKFSKMIKQDSFSQETKNHKIQNKLNNYTIFESNQSQVINHFENHKSEVIHKQIDFNSIKTIKKQEKQKIDQLDQINQDDIKNTEKIHIQNNIKNSLPDQTGLTSQILTEQSFFQAKSEEKKINSNKSLNGDKSSRAQNERYKNLNFDDQSFNPTNLQVDNSDNISMTHSQNSDASNGFKKTNKRKKNKFPRESSLMLNLNVIEPQINFDESNMEDLLPEQNQNKSSYSLSSQQIKKRKKRNFNTINFDSDIIREGKQQDFDYNRPSTFQYTEDGNTILSESTGQVAKRKKARNKKLFNVQQQDTMNEIQILVQNDEDSNENNQLNKIKTLQITSDMGSNPSMSYSSNIKKRKKTKKLKDLNLEGDQQQMIVIQANQINEQKFKQNRYDLDEESHKPTDDEIVQVKAQKKAKRRVRKQEDLKQQQQEIDIVDLGEIN